MTDEEKMAVHRQNVREEDKYLTDLREEYLTALQDNDENTLEFIYEELEFYIPPVELFYELDPRNILFVVTNNSLLDDFDESEYSGFIHVINALQIDEASYLLDFIINEMNKNHLNGDELKLLIKKLRDIVSFNDFEKVSALYDKLIDRARFSSEEEEQDFLSCCDLLVEAKENTLKRKGWKVIEGDNDKSLTNEEINKQAENIRKRSWRVIDGGLEDN